jgi:predicted  nucleic acid-binding Zn-ribbon protein
MTQDFENNIVKERVTQIEDAVLNLSAEIQHLQMQIKDIQSMIIKIATNQQQLAERVSMWPFIKVDTSKKRRPPKNED